MGSVLGTSTATRIGRWTFGVRRSTFLFVENHRALLIVGHGSTVNPDSSAPTLAHAAEIRRRAKSGPDQLFVDVACAFWKEEPSLRDARFLFPPEHINEVYVVPNFISEGYFTQTVIPRELELTGPITRRNGQTWKYCEPVGNHPAMTDLLLKRAEEIGGMDPAETALLIVAHGTDLNDNSAAAAKREVEKISALNRFAEVLNVYMEEPPLVADWAKLTHARNVVVVPFFISDGLHSFEDIPVLLGIGRQSLGEVLQRTPHQLEGRSLYYASAIGTEPQFADIIIDTAEKFERAAKT